MKTASNNVALDLGEIRLWGNIGFENSSPSQAGSLFNDVISTVIGTLTVVGAIWFLIQLLVGALGVISSGGDKVKLTEARDKITYAIIGIAVVIAAIFLAEIIGIIFGLDIMGGPANLLEP